MEESPTSRGTGTTSFFVRSANLSIRGHDLGLFSSPGCATPVPYWDLVRLLLCRKVWPQHGLYFLSPRNFMALHRSRNTKQSQSFIGDGVFLGQMIHYRSEKISGVYYSYPSPSRAMALRYAECHCERSAAIHVFCRDCFIAGTPRTDRLH